MSLRPLLPATDGRGPSNRLPDDVNNRPPRKRARTIIQACNYCRRVKAKCDGRRPKCSTCTTKSQECGYAGGPGQSRQEAMKTRLQVLDDLFKFLQVKSPAQATRLLERIRSAEDLTLFGHSPDNELMDLEDGDESTHSSGQLQTESSVSSSRAAPDSLLSVNFSLSDIDSFDRGIEGFFSCSGKLFHVFTRDEVAKFQSQIFSVNELAVQKACICYAAAVAAVGSQYLHDTDSREAEQTLYDIAKYYFEDVLQASPLHAVKVCTLLAMYNILEKATLSQTYVEIGLSLSRRYGLHQNFRDAKIPPDLWGTCQKSWRTLMFFQGWLAAALGGISPNDRLPSRLDLLDFNFEPSSDLEERVQTEMTKIAVIKANILRMNLTLKDLYMLSIDTMLRDLEQWYAALPEEMHIDNISRVDVSHSIRRSTYHVHLLYLGSIALLYRRVASHLLQAKTSETSRQMLGNQLPTIRQTMRKGEEAAKKSAHVLNLLLSENDVFRRCWVVTFQAYNSATILLYETMKRILSSRPASEWEDDLEQARNCIHLLKFCSTEDPVSRIFLKHIQGAYEGIQEHLQSPEFRSPIRDGVGMEMDGIDGTATSPTTDDDFNSLAEKLLGLPKDDDAALAKKALRLMELLCQPFGDPDDMFEAEHEVKINLWEDPTRYEFAHLVGRLEWEFECKQPFQYGSKASSAEPEDGRLQPQVHPPTRYT